MGKPIASVSCAWRMRLHHGGCVRRPPVRHLIGADRRYIFLERSAFD